MGIRYSQSNFKTLNESGRGVTIDCVLSITIPFLKKYIFCIIKINGIQLKNTHLFLRIGRVILVPPSHNVYSVIKIY